MDGIHSFSLGVLVGGGGGWGSGNTHKIIYYLGGLFGDYLKKTIISCHFRQKTTYSQAIIMYDFRIFTVTIAICGILLCVSGYPDRTKWGLLIPRDDFTVNADPQ